MTRTLALIPLLLSCNGGDKGTGPVTDDTAADTAVEKADPYDVVVGPYDATVRWTEYGVPHITGEDDGSVGYGMGYAHARDYFCTLMDQVVLVSSERSKHLGEGAGGANLDTDIGWKALGVRAEAEDKWFELPERMRERVKGYAAGVNRYLDETGVDGLPAWCAGESWVREIDHIDLYSYYLALSLNGSGGVWVEEIAQAEPPDAANALREPPGTEDLEYLADLPMGSNGWALGSERTASGSGMLLSNTHFPAVGERTWHESHLTIPGQLDVYGASLVGVPAINIGFNKDVAWTHTVSQNPRFVANLYELDPDDPTRYLYDGEYEDMISTDYTVEVLQEDGSLETVTRTTWATRHGPVIFAPLIGWSPTLAVGFKDANAGNHELLQVWAAMNEATSMEEFKAAHDEHPGIPWVHTMAVDAEGTAWYIDSARTPNWSEEAEEAWVQLAAENSLVGVFAGYGVYAVDGGDPVYEWVTDPDGPEGVVSAARAPQLERTDFVFNANDNHWLTNPESLLEGYPMLYGATGTGRSLRTRMNAVYLTETGEGSAAGADGKFTLDELESAALSCRVMGAELVRQDIVDFCEGAESLVVSTDSGDLDLTPACQAMASFTSTCATEDPGAALFREFMGSGEFGTFRDAGDFFAESFDPSQPVATPAGLDTSSEEAQQRVIDAMVTAVRNLEAAGIEVDATLGETQYMAKQGDTQPFVGGTDLEGAIAIATWSGGASRTVFTEMERGEVINGNTSLTEDGYAVNYGNSFVLTVDLAGGEPEARAVVTYSQSQDPESPHYADQSDVYAEGQLRAVRFSEEDILADPTLVEVSLSMEQQGG